ncbi:uncharacterized protein si:ch73-6k14.2 [Mugil cephalus]|uniref:uncharacterized protein si:ch73-6k14.2 n=1 Tax=Mugil cephalus TaxID=48193 RepID=UPI001FB83C66|nr:uncharacterized protein si:ch73-6k14.2 [Mugil cephalus]
MKPRCVRSTVDRLPTISEMQESDVEDGDLDSSYHTLDEYVDSIKELSQPAPFPLHGPLRGHRRWMVCTRGLRAAPLTAPAFPNSSRSYAPWLPVDLSDVLLTLTDQSNYDAPQRFGQTLLDILAEQSLYAGLV